jgi:hypothetical protein
MTATNLCTGHPFHPAGPHRHTRWADNPGGRAMHGLPEEPGFGSGLIAEHNEDGSLAIFDKDVSHRVTERESTMTSTIEVGADLTAMTADQIAALPEGATLTITSKPGVLDGVAVVFGCQRFTVGRLLAAGITIRPEGDGVICEGPATIEGPSGSKRFRILDRTLHRSDVNEWTTSIVVASLPEDDDADLIRRMRSAWGNATGMRAGLRAMLDVARDDEALLTEMEQAWNAAGSSYDREPAVKAVLAVIREHDLSHGVTHRVLLCTDTTDHPATPHHHSTSANSGRLNFARVGAPERVGYRREKHPDGTQMVFAKGEHVGRPA